MLLCLRKQLAYRETATGVEVTELSVVKAEGLLPPHKTKLKKVKAKKVAATAPEPAAP